MGYNKNYIDALSTKNYEALELYLKLGEDPNFGNGYGLAVAIVNYDEKLYRLLRKFGADIQLTTSTFGVLQAFDENSNYSKFILDMENELKKGDKSNGK